jgi:hypothetical protein
MWEHSRRVTKILFDKPTVGPCSMHGIDNHVCKMYTASEDRSLRVWDLKRFVPLKNVQTNM